jgi:hypothetical protein
MRDIGEIPSWVGTPVADCDGVAVGVVEEVYFDARSHCPVWLLVDLGGRLALVPAGDLRDLHRAVVVPHARHTILEAPGAGHAPSPAPELAARLRRHYGLRPLGGPWPEAVQAAHPERALPDLVATG